MNTLNSEETTASVREAFSKLSSEDQKEIRRIAQTLVRKIHRKNPNIRFGMDSALEVIACLGIAINDNRLRFVK